MNTKIILFLILLLSSFAIWGACPSVRSNVAGTQEYCVKNAVNFCTSPICDCAVTNSTSDPYLCPGTTYACGISQTDFDAIYDSNSDKEVRTEFYCDKACADFETKAECVGSVAYCAVGTRLCNDANCAHLDRSSCSIGSNKLDLSTEPMFSIGTAQPNIIFNLDDSYSMTYEVMPDANAHYLFPQTMASSDIYFEDLSSLDTWVVPSVEDVYSIQMRSSSQNSMYYNPAIDYEPWVVSDGVNVTPYRSASDTVSGKTIFDDNGNVLVPDDGGEVCAPFNPAKLAAGCLVLNRVVGAPSGSIMYSGPSSTFSSTKTQYFYPAVYYVFDTSNTGCNATKTDVIGCYDEYIIAPQELNSADVDFSAALDTNAMYTTVYDGGNGIEENLTSKDTIGPALDEYKKVIFTTTPLSTYAVKGRSYDAEMQNFANWFTYHRSRLLATRGAAATAFSELSTSNRVGLSTLNSSVALSDATVDTDSSIIQEPRKFFGSNRTDFYAKLFEVDALSSGANLAKSTDAIGYFFNYPTANSKYDVGPWATTPLESDAETIDEAETCRRSFHVMVSDAGSDAATTVTSSNSSQTTLKAIADYYFDTDLQDDGSVDENIANNLDPVDLDGNGSATGYGEDPNEHQHLVNTMIAIGEGGSITIPSLGDTIDSDSFDSSATSVGDMFNAALESGGLFYSVGNSDELLDAIRGALKATILSTSSASSGASVALNSGALFNGSVLFQALFDASDWSGALYAFLIDPDTGALPSTPSAVFTVPSEITTGRNIASYGLDGADGVGVTFDLVTSSAIDLDGKYLDVAGTETLISAIESDTSLDDKVVAWLRGDTSIDGTAYGSNVFRDRTDSSNFIANKSPLGDIVYSAPVYIGQPYSNSVLGDDYLTFRQNNCILSDPNCVDSNGGLVSSSYTPRRELVLAGANDGMLHIFEIATTTDDTTGEVSISTSEEIAAYLPKAVIEEGNLAGTFGLASSAYEHKYFVDGTVDIGSAYFDSAWHVVVVGGLGGGGKGIYALDITDTDTSLDSDDSNGIIGDLPGNVMWEYTAATPIEPSGGSYGHTDTADEDLGYTYSRPVIAKLPTDQWVVIFGNGYNAEDSDGDASLYVLDLETGKRLFKFNTGVGFAEAPIDAEFGKQVDYPNGLSSPAIVDFNNDGRTDSVYAGDLYGNLWRFDFICNNTSCSSVTLQSANYDSVSGDDVPAPIFQAGIFTSGSEQVQPITTKPQITNHPERLGGYMVYFGTGKYIENSDRDSTHYTFDDTQTFYGIWDRSLTDDTVGNDTYIAFGRDYLLEQKILLETEITEKYEYKDDLGNVITVIGDTFDYRITTDNKMTWHEDETSLPSTDPSVSEYLGWYMDLVNTDTVANPSGLTFGERQITDPIVRNGRVIFTTTIPDGDLCGSSDSGWLMELDAANGGYLPVTPFDTNGDGAFGSADYYTYDPNPGVVDPTKVAVAGRKSTVGILPTPGILSDYSDAATNKEYKYMSGSDGVIETVSENAGNINYGRQSWRQLFR